MSDRFYLMICFVYGGLLFAGLVLCVLQWLRSRALPKCQRCDGRGTFEVEHMHGADSVLVIRRCDVCHGRGRV